jgi:plasmid stabilization system protein ParE
MTIKLSAAFREKLSNQVRYIARDKPGAAKKFKDNLLLEIRKFSAHPYTYRKSIFFNNSDIRDFIFKGYTITFRIKVDEEVIEVFGFHKYEDPNKLM